MLKEEFVTIFHVHITVYAFSSGSHDSRLLNEPDLMQIGRELTDLWGSEGRVIEMSGRWVAIFCRGPIVMGV
jgi:hypothetical protein